MYKPVRKLGFRIKLVVKETFPRGAFPKSYIIKDIPYYQQLETGKNAWRMSGAKSKKEYLHWGTNGCGMACFKMILEYLTNKKVPLVTLGKQCLRYGGYRFDVGAYNRDDTVNSLPGLFYKGFVDFAKTEYGINTRFVTPLVTKEIIRELSKGNLVMASVSSGIRNPQIKPPERGGHIVLMVGYDLGKQVLSLHNPSGIYRKSQKYAQVKIKDFKKFFANRGVIILRK